MVPGFGKFRIDTHRLLQVVAGAVEVFLKVLVVCFIELLQSVRRRRIGCRADA